MTAAIATEEKYTGPSRLLHTLSFTFALLTVIFALLSFIFGNRLSTLQTHFLTEKIETATSNAASLQDMEATIATANDKLEATQKRLNREKTAAEKLRQKLAALVNDLEKTKADLASANQTIANLEAKVPFQATPSVKTPALITTPIVTPSTESVLSPAPPPQSISPPNESSVVPSPAIVPPSDTPPTVTKAPISESTTPQPPPSAPAAE
jgi:uncharacterized coiled-coil protein SlyX